MIKFKIASNEILKISRIKNVKIDFLIVQKLGHNLKNSFKVAQKLISNRRIFESYSVGLQQITAKHTQKKFCNSMRQILV